MLMRFFIRTSVRIQLLTRTFLDYFFGPRGFAYVLFLIIGGISLICLIPRVLVVKPGPPDPRITLAVSVSTSLLILGLVEVAAKTLELFREGIRLPLFREFFGADACRSSGIETVFPSAQLPDFCPDPILVAPAPNPRVGVNIKLTSPPHKAGDTLPKGIKEIVPFQDLEGVLKIDRAFRRYGASLHLVLDTFRDSPLPPAGCIGIGLGYNNITVSLMGKLYEVKYDTPGNENSDDVVLGNGQVGPMSNFDDYALIARVLRGTTRKPVPYIICAGHTSLATRVACEFLAENWLQLADKYLQDSNNPMPLNAFSMAVFLRFKNSAINQAELGTPYFISINT